MEGVQFKKLNDEQCEFLEFTKQKVSKVKKCSVVDSNGNQYDVKIRDILLSILSTRQYEKRYIKMLNELRERYSTEYKLYKKSNRQWDL